MPASIGLPQFARHTASLISLSAFSMMLCGCVGVRLKKAEIAQLDAELVAVADTTKTLSSMPPLSYAVISGEAANQLLSKLDGYKVILDHPKGATATIDKARINFKDGFAEASIESEAIDRNNLIHVKLNVVADVCVTVEGSALHLRFVPVEILPRAKMSIFRWHEFLFVASLLRIEASKFADSMPDAIIPIKETIHLDIDAPTSAKLSFGDAQNLEARQVFPDRHLLYGLNVKHAVLLNDGIHVFLGFDRAN